jgi:hypothetical protein
VEIFKTSRSESDSEKAVLAVTPLGAAIGGIGRALLSGFIAIRDVEIVFEREPAGSNDR